MTDRLLVLVRHGQSEWNLQNLFTGWRDVGLTEKGVAEARAAGRQLKALGLRFDIAFTSALTRAQRTLDLMLEELGQRSISVLRDQALNERDYGDLSGLNKDDARRKWGEEQVHLWRRSYDVAPPGGESLKDTAARVLPYYVQEILPRVLRGERTLVSAHGNSLRALVMVLDHLSPQEIVKRELATGVPLVYRLNTDLTVAERQVMAAEGGLDLVMRGPALRGVDRCTKRGRKSCLFSRRQKGSNRKSAPARHQEQSLESKFLVRLAIETAPKPGLASTQ